MTICDRDSASEQESPTLDLCHSTPTMHITYIAKLHLSSLPHAIALTHTALFHSILSHPYPYISLYTLIQYKIKHLTEHGSSQNSGELGVDLPAPPGGAGSAELQRQMFPGDPQGGLSPLVQRGALNDMRKGSNSNGSNPFGKGVEGQITISSLIWDGGYLWKIPYNGKGSPEKRIVSIKRSSVHPSPGSRAVCIDRNGTLSKPDNFIAYPPTLTWYNSDKPGQVKNARELILYEGTCLMEGHNTNAFYKLASKDKPLPRPELCFSMMTTTRSLDMAAESVKDAGKLRGVKELLGL